MGRIIANFGKRIFQPLWQAFVNLVDTLLSWVIELLNALICSLLRFLFWMIEQLLMLIPQPPNPAEHDLSPALQTLATANQYVPLSEIFALLPILGGAFAVIATYKIAKFIRGAG